MLFDKYWEELEADFQSEYGLDLSDVWRGKMSFRRCAVLIEQLMPGSRFCRAMGGSAALSDDGHLLRMIEADIRSFASGKQQPPIELPEEGWREKSRERSSRDRRKVENWLKRHPEARN